MTKMTTCVSDSHICAPEIYEAFLKEQMFKIYLKPVWIRVSAVRLTYTKTDNHSSTKMAQKKNEQPPLIQTNHVISIVKGQFSQWLRRQLYVSHLATVQAKHKIRKNETDFHCFISHRWEMFSLMRKHA